MKKVIVYIWKMTIISLLYKDINDDIIIAELENEKSTKCIFSLRRDLETIDLSRLMRTKSEEKKTQTENGKAIKEEMKLIYKECEKCLKKRGKYYI
jgi:hypothetical protein